jgi:hypothetical protein
MIHIRLDEDTHKRLKLEAVHQDSTVQDLVERLIRRRLVNSREKDVT